MKKRYRVIKEFFVDAHDEYDAETKAEDKKIKLSWTLIDVQEVVGGRTSEMKKYLPNRKAQAR